MIRSLVGVYDARGAGAQSGLPSKLASALDGGEGVRAMEDGPLAVAWTGRADSSQPVRPGPFCLLDGHIYNLEDVARDIGVAAPEEPESLLAIAYERLGEAMFSRLRGDFVVLVWDREAGRLLLARDQVNVRPLYVNATDRRVAFASEVHHLLEVLPRRPGPDRRAVAYWLAESRVPTDRTLYEGVWRLEAGHYLRMAGGRWEKRRYWRPRYKGTLHGSRTELMHELRRVLGQAILRRCRPEERTGIFLSGGIDSSSVAAIATHVLEPDRTLVGAYSATFPNHPATDESGLIDLSIAKLGLPSTRIVVYAGSVLAGSLEYLRAWHLPPISPTEFFWVPMARRAAEDGTPVLLDGEDGDSLFGANQWLLADLLRRGHLPSAVGLVRSCFTENGRPVSWRATARLLSTTGLKGNAPYVAHRIKRRTRRPEDFAPSWFNAESAQAYFDTVDYWAWKRVGGPRWWANRTQALLTGAHPAGLFDHCGRRSALAGIESRHPFADLELIEFVQRAPPELAFDPRFDRPLLRDAVAGFVPDRVRLRPEKSFFDSIFHDSLVANDLPAVRRLVCSRDAEVAAYVRPDRVREELFETRPQDHPEGMNNWAAQVWRLVTIECWLRFQHHRSFPEDLLAKEDLRESSYEFARVSPEWAAGAPYGGTPGGRRSP